ncbi:type II secretion system minor pseudopilin GspJ [Pacificimonas sp. WHA3]|uniref:Type II secretion system minor pseudopilin GspJ n=1 Tax=Pacificimonas pallii TaxID=2827236 RepID=A0ABS6SHE6_9SPHN|nr:type II secretion system minor pseudopilin GspJ [Pacificimonas pallii]MBV7257815.1 type II secretion system minor pseudopilin GspJ [Pacificimonas pallii]
MMRRNEVSREQGFTLVETLVALFVFALVVGASTFVFGQTVRASQGIEAASKEVQALQRTRAALRADLLQMVARPSRDENGDARAILAGGDNAEVLLAFVRRGPDDQERAGRPSMQYVEWQLTGRGLERRTAPFVDGVAAETPALLFPGARRAKVEFNVKGAWSDRVPRTLPSGTYVQAIRLTLDHPRFGPTQQLFMTGLPS